MVRINDGLTVLFSTSGNSEKIMHVKQNPNIALAVGNLKIEATAELFGHSKGHSFFIADSSKKFPRYGAQCPERPDDILVIAKPKKVCLYKYFGKPCEGVLDVDNQSAYRIDLI
jgi:hypothetical protein